MAFSAIDPIKYFISGGVAGICTVLAGHPLDTIKVRLQTMPKPAPGKRPKYTGTLDCFKKTIAKEGILGLYKGITAPLFGVAPLFAISFFTFGIGKRAQQKSPKDNLALYQIFLAGGFSGFCCAFVAAPCERIKCLLQSQSQEIGISPKYTGMIDAGRKLHKEGGFKSIFRGTFATLLRDIPSSGMYFLTYEFCQKHFTPIDPKTGKVGKISILSTIFAGGMAGIGGWSVGMPADVLKSRLQTAPDGTYPKGLRSVFEHLIRTEGPKALFTGTIPVILRAFPANAACFVGFETCMKFLNWIEPMLD